MGQAGRRARHAPLLAAADGGDQVYADSLWTTVPSLKAWNRLDMAEKVKRKATRTMEEQLDRFYCDLYCKQWGGPRWRACWPGSRAP